jgi:hypothetical protein
MMRARWLPAVLLLLSCGPDNGLGGSMSEVFPLDVSRVEVARNEQAIQVTYLLNRGLFLDVVARVTVDVEGVNFVPGKPVKLGAPDGGTAEYAPGHPRCVVTHAPGGEPVRNLPLVLEGDLTLSHGGQPGTDTSGSFSMRFGETEGDIGFNRTLSGTFHAMAIDAGFGELP